VDEKARDDASILPSKQKVTEARLVQPMQPLSLLHLLYQVTVGSDLADGQEKQIVMRIRGIICRGHLAHRHG
jgi:hypothetical protein